MKPKLVILLFFPANYDLSSNLGTPRKNTLSTAFSSGSSGKSGSICVWRRVVRKSFRSFSREPFHTNIRRLVKNNSVSCIWKSSFRSEISANSADLNFVVCVSLSRRTPCRPRRGADVWFSDFLKFSKHFLEHFEYQNVPECTPNCF